MTRAVKDAKLSSRTARAALPRSSTPYYRAIDPGLHLGYRQGRAGGKWLVRWYVGDGKYKVETIGTADDHVDADGEVILDFRQAQAKARAVHDEAIGRGKVTGPYTVAKAVDDYLTWMERERKTARDSRSRAEALVLPQLGEVECSKLTKKALEDWLHGLADAAPRLRTKKGKEQQFREVDDSPETKRRRRSTANRTLTILKAALNHAWRDGKIATDEAWRRVQPFKGVDAARVRYLTVKEAQRLLNGCDPTFRPIVRAALLTGCRYGELAALDVHDFHPDAGTVHVRTSKSGRPRHVVLNDDGIAFFKTTVAGRPGAAPMFEKAGGGRWGRSHQDRPMRDACERAKISPAVTFHILRHTWASLSIMAGAPLMVVAQNLGHADTRMVERHYGHLANSYVAETIRATAPSFGVEEPGNVVEI